LHSSIEASASSRSPTRCGIPSSGRERARDFDTKKITAVTNYPDFV
jgi:hypothetical protein